ncbi:MAG: hypothetical protein KJ063_21575 [Anaerolineae bacterium]|nr:hypothetical protein [Anaerolineae bacterium]
MSRIIRSILLFGLFLILLLSPLVVRYLGHYRLFSREARPPVPVYNPGEAVSVVPTPVSRLFTDEPEVTSSGYVLLDMAHGNYMDETDITYLDSRLSLRGHQFARFTGGDLATALRRVNAFVVIAPLNRFTNAEIAAVRDFVDRGGRVLMVGDPTRFNVIFSDDFFSFSYTIENDDIALNSLANEFDIIFTGDYLYNTVNNEGNFRNIIIEGSGISEHALTAGLRQIAFYGSHSLMVGNGGRALLTGDRNTWSSATDRPVSPALAVLNQNGRVLAVGDVDFLAAPYYTSLDNSEFVARIADFLVGSSERRFVLRDFPFFYSPNVNLIYAGSPDLGPSAFDDIIALQQAFRNVNIRLNLAAAPAANHDILYLGLYNQASELEDFLKQAGITLVIDPPITTDDEDKEDDSTGTPTPTPTSDNGDDTKKEKDVRQIQSSLGNIQMSGTSLILLDESQGQRRVIVLAASKAGLESTVNRLINMMPLNASYTLADCLVQDTLALCPSGVNNEEVEAELDTGGAPEPSATPVPGTGTTPAPDTGTEDELGAIRQGTISLGQTVNGTLEPDELHSWVFNGGPAVIDITVQGSNLDAVLELYDSNFELLEYRDSTFSNQAETIRAVNIPDGDNYYIVVYDYFGDPSDYTLTVTTSEAGSGDASIFIFVDDDGTPAAGGIRSGEAIAAVLAAQYETTIWTTSIDGPLSENTLAGYNVIIWDSGDYRTSNEVFDPDMLIIFGHVFDAGAALIIFGATPALLDFDGGDLVALSDIEATEDEPILMDGIAIGDVYALDRTYQVVNVLLEDIDPENDLLLFSGGPNSPAVTFAGAASQAEISIFFLLSPYVALPTTLQQILLPNILAWMGF